MRNYKNVRNWPETKSEIVENYIAEVADELSKHNGKLIFSKNRIGSDKSAGEFYHVDDKPVVKVCTGYTEEKWLGTLVHEAKHFEQYLENCKVWENFEEGYYDASVIFNKEKTSTVRERCCNTILKLELDCEIRAVETIRSHKLPIDIDNYIRLSNLILYKWIYAKKWAIWPVTSERILDELTKLCPTKFIKSFNSIPSRLDSKLRQISPK